MIRTLNLSARRALAPLPVAALLIALSCQAAFAAGAPRILYLGGGDKPAGPAAPRALAPFDCAGLDTLTLAPALWDTAITGDTTGAPALIAGYGCRTWPEQGPEHIYRLEVTADLQLWAGLSGLGTQDLDIFLFDGCDTDQCLAGANTELQAVLPAGTYWLVVDGYGTSTPAAGPYTLSLQTRSPGVPPQICEVGGATGVTCAGALITLPGDLTDAPNLLQAYDCSPSLVVGGEAWYAIELPATHQVTVQATPDAAAPALDVALWLFNGCGAAATCLDFADEKAGGQVETLTFDNTGETPVTIYLAVDAHRVPGENESGVFLLELLCQSNVATEKSSLGSVRALFR